MEIDKADRNMAVCSWGIRKMINKGVILIFLFVFLPLLAGCGRNDEQTISKVFELDSTVKSESEELLDAFLAGEIPAIYDNGNESVVMFDQLPFDEQDWFSYTAGERIDLDNDGENEQIVNGPYGGIYFDARDEKVYVLGEGEGITGLLSYTNYDNATWMVHSDTTHMGRQTFWLTRYDGEGNIV
ncbi:MAG: hypothetical protein K2H45_01770, partial [Acetatifactor sp.]|nr:hypothetical protein [Acetatifactor sp.]